MSSEELVANRMVAVLLDNLFDSLRLVDGYSLRLVAVGLWMMTGLAA